MFFPPPVEMTILLHLFPFIIIPFAIPPSIRFNFFIFPTKLEFYGDIAKLVPEFIIDKDDSSNPDVSSNKCGMPPLTRSL